jgi:hypothetical protein
VTTILTQPLPSPHDPWERCALAWVGEWDVRQFSTADPKLDYFRRRGFLHLQLWHPGARISILTPSRLTAGNFEAWAQGGERFAVSRWNDLGAHFEGIALPTATEVAALESWFVRREEPRALHQLRTWWNGTARKALRRG